jgi:hypothetical protein
MYTIYAHRCLILANLACIPVEPYTKLANSKYDFQLINYGVHYVLCARTNFCFHAYNLSCIQLVISGVSALSTFSERQTWVLSD